MGRMYLKKKKKCYYWIIFIIVFFFMIVLSIFRYVSENISPKLVKYASVELKKISNYIVSKSLTYDDFANINLDDLFIITRNDKNEILTFDLNTMIVNKLLFCINDSVQENLKQLELGNINEYNEKSDGVVLKIPIGVVTKNFLLSNYGPMIPVKVKILGNIDSNLSTKITNYGINSALVEINIEITVTELVILPITVEEVSFISKFPIVVKLVNGTVPDFYPNGLIERRYDEKI